LKAKALEVPTDQLRPNPWNTNRCSPENEARLEGSLDRFDGLFKPIIVREVKGAAGYEILGGEHRWLIAKRKKLAKVPVWNLGHLADKMAKEISIADNARYGADDTLALSELFKDLGESAEDIQSYLPYGDVDIQSIFSSTDIALDDLVLDDDDEKSFEPEATPKLPKTHTLMRFKVAIEDAERLSELIARTQKTYGFTSSDQATNAGDALVHLLLNGGFEATDDL
jgi:ParB-like chromosome segregation protein Spo0J